MVEIKEGQQLIAHPPTLTDAGHHWTVASSMAHKKTQNERNTKILEYIDLQYLQGL